MDLIRELVDAEGITAEDHPRISLTLGVLTGLAQKLENEGVDLNEDFALLDTQHHAITDHVRRLDLLIDEIPIDEPVAVEKFHLSRNTEGWVLAIDGVLLRGQKFTATKTHATADTALGWIQHLINSGEAPRAE